MHGWDDSLTEGHGQQLIGIFDVGILAHCPFQVHQELVPVDVAIFIHINSFQRLQRIPTHKAAKVGSHEAIVEGTELENVVNFFILLDVPFVPDPCGPLQ